MTIIDMCQDSMSQNEIYELVADFGEVYGGALPRNSHLARGIDWPENWLEISDKIGDVRAEILCQGLDIPSPDELKHLTHWQVNQALAANNPDIIATIWLCCKNDEDEIIAVEGWGASLFTELKFKLIDRYPDKNSAIKDLRMRYLFNADDLDDKINFNRLNIN